MTELLLHSLAGRPAPEELGPSLAAIFELPESAHANFKDLIVPNLEPLPEDQLDNRIVRLCRRMEIDPEKAAPPIKSTRFLLRAAASHNTSAEHLAEDLRALCPDTHLAEILLPIYEEVQEQLRDEVLAGTLQAHGNLLNGLEWRIDTIGSSNLGSEINAPVALLTMHYQDRQQARSFTVQMLPNMVAQLRDLCNELLSS